MAWYMYSACLSRIWIKVCTRIFISEIDELYYKHEFCMYRNSSEGQLYFKHKVKKLPREKMFIMGLVYVQGINSFLSEISIGHERYTPTSVIGTSGIS